MEIDELTMALRSGESTVEGRGPDLRAIRSRGHRLRWARRAARTGVAAATVAVVAGAAYTLAGGVGPERGLVAADELNPLAARALAEIPGAYRVGDTVFVPETPRPGNMMEGPLTSVHIHAEVVPLTVHGYSDLAYLTSGSQFPKWLRNAVYDNDWDDPVRADNGPLSLACVGWQDEPERCGLTAMVQGADGSYYRLTGLSGTDKFMKPGAGIQVFIDEDYLDGTLSVVGGMHGTEAVQVEVVLVDGTRSPARLSREVVEGNTVFWAEVPDDVAQVIAYGEEGEVLESHEIEPCDDPVDCEVR